MANFYTNLLLFVFLISTDLVSLTISQQRSRAPVPLCSPVENGNYSANSVYQTNLNQLLELMYTNTNTGLNYYNFSYGQNPDKVYASAVCRGDIESDVCQTCIQEACTNITTLCPYQKKAIMTTNACALRYSDHNIFGVLEFKPEFLVFDINVVQNVDGYHHVLMPLLNRLQDQAAAGDDRLKFAKGKAAAPNNQTIYGLVQCAPDLSKNQCNECIYNATARIGQCCVGSQGGRVFYPSCFLRYEIYQFYEDLNVTTPPPLPPPPPSKGKDITYIIIIVSVVTFVILIIGVCICIILRVRNTKENVETNLQRFNFATIRVATDRFSDANKLGKGGFGAVYKGRLSDTEEIAVKRLSMNSEQGEVEFKNEVKLLAKVQHRNLVRLLGFCMEGKERLLVYEYLPNSSLNNFIFDGTHGKNFDWERRKKIISGIARGLNYLHEDSRLRIIHCDLKASNILLDEELVPKISDFGMARFFKQDQTQENTDKISGTFGYMAPEYINSGQVSAKSDVFSFGILVLEIVIGQKNSHLRTREEVTNLQTYAWENWMEGRASNLVDSNIKASWRSEKLRCIHIGLLCAQENVEDRPTMTSVVGALNSPDIPLPEPARPGFFTHSAASTPSLFVYKSGMSSSQSLFNTNSGMSINETSVTGPYPR